jgi:DNA-binding NarL/FixJ family response regulator
MRVAIAEDSRILRDALARLLTKAGVEVTAQAASGDELLAGVAADPPDVAILDIRMPPGFSEEGLDVAEQLRRQYPQVGVLVLSAYDQITYADRLFKNGTAGLGYLLKQRVDTVEELRDAITQIAAGQHAIDPQIVDLLLAKRSQEAGEGLAKLTDDERDVLRLMAEGRSNHGIARRLRLSEQTVQEHVASVFDKLDLLRDDPETADHDWRVIAALMWLRGGQGDS